MALPRVLLADDHTIVADGLRSLLNQHFDLVGTVGDGEALVEAARRLRPDIIVSDISMPGLSGLEVQESLARAGREVTIIFISGYADVRSSVRVVGSAAFDSLLTLVTLDSLAIRADTVSWQLAKRTNVEIARTRWSVDGLDLRSRSSRRPSAIGHSMMRVACAAM